ncbi:MAG: ABC transporter permease [Pseudomonadota bacterium]
MMRAYISVVSARYRTLLQYRAAAIAGLITQLFWGAIKIMVFFAFYSLSTEEQPISLVQVVSYVWLGQALLGMLPWNVDKEIEALIRQGSVSYELVRPLDLYNFWFARTVALRTATTTLRSIPMIAFAMVLLPFFGLDDWALQPPADLAAFLCFLVSLFAALLLSSAFTMLMHVFLVWTISGEGLNRIMPSLTMVFSGMVVPLPLFPQWLQPFLNAQPFRGLVDVPFRIYTGNIPAMEAAPDILHQLVWTLVFILIGRWLLSRSLKQLVVQGG